MVWHKIVDPINCRFASAHDEQTGRLRLGREALELRVERLVDDAFRVRVLGSRFGEQTSQVELELELESVAGVASGGGGVEGAVVDDGAPHDGSPGASSASGNAASGNAASGNAANGNAANGNAANGGARGGDASAAVASGVASGKGSREATPARVAIGARGELEVSSADGQRLLSSVPRQAFGTSGSAWLFQFEVPREARFYGLGEKCVGFERSGLSTQFYNTDVWADFSQSEIETGAPDPLYASVPWVAIRCRQGWVGLLLNGAGSSFMRTPPRNEDSAPRRLWLGARQGAVELFVLVAPSLSRLTERLQRLVGVTPRPPLWALGHHQSRWGYESEAQLDELADRFDRHRLPNDGLWLDIGYMRGYRVFTVDEGHFPKPAKALASLRRRGYRVVPILDPGVKLEKGYDVYDEGRRRRAFCQNPEGDPFVGYVWPGQTVFPDFSLAPVRELWAERVAKLARLGFAGFWLDMNDPSTGATDCADMLFDRGKQPHDTFHNQYASGMARASREGLLRARPKERPFLLTRSACAGTGRYAAVWTGDNCSNWHHLKKSIEVSLNLALSGIPFNGPDVPGFGLDAEPDLALAWYQAAFLFPFLRNHCQIGRRAQEPWTFGPRSRHVYRYVRLRYKLLPYLYQLFVRQERSGAAILRPLFYDCEHADLPGLFDVDDQFLVGPDLMQAPLLQPGSHRRSVLLPPGHWYDARTGRWLRGGRRINVTCEPEHTPLYVRAGAVVPMQLGERKTNDSDLANLEIHLFCPPGHAGELDYVLDDGETFAYRRGKETRIAISIESPARGQSLSARVRVTKRRAGNPTLRFVVHGRPRLDAIDLSIDGAASRKLTLRPRRVALTGEVLGVGGSRSLALA